MREQAFVNVRWWLGVASGYLNWSPDTFWRAQLWEVQNAYLWRLRHDNRRDAVQASRLINGVRGAFHKKKWDEITPDQFLPERGGEAEDVATQREKAAQSLPSTLD